MRLICFGELLIDMTPTDMPDNYTANPGGAPCNVAVAAAMMGCKAYYIGKVGDDIMGKLMIKTLSEKGVDCSNVLVDGRFYTTLAFVKLSNGERSFSFYRLADKEITSDEIKPEFIKEGEVFHFGSLSLTEQPVKDSLMLCLKTAVESGLKISFDVNYRSTLWKSEELARKEILSVIEEVDYLKVSEEELLFLTGEKDLKEGAKKLLDMGAIDVIVSLGEKGSAFFSADKEVYAPAFKIVPVDTTGAGDAFWGTFLSEFALSSSQTEEKIYDSLLKANAAGALAACGYGAIPSIASKAELKEFMDKNVCKQ